MANIGFLQNFLPRFILHRKMMLKFPIPSVLNKINNQNPLAFHLNNNQDFEDEVFIYFGAFCHHICSFLANVVLFIYKV